jgi:hypothetical protein
MDFPFNYLVLVDLTFCDASILFNDMDGLGGTIYEFGFLSCLLSLIN